MRPCRPLLWLMLLLPLLLVGCEYGRMWETPAVRPHEEPIVETEPGTVPLSGGEAGLRLARAEDLSAPFSLNSPEVVASGKPIYASYCVHCHGRHHDGLGTVGQSFIPPIPDLRREAIQSRHPGHLFKEISYGIPDGRQPDLASTIEIADRWRVIAYVKSLGTR